MYPKRSCKDGVCLAMSSSFQYLYLIVYMSLFSSFHCLSVWFFRFFVASFVPSSCFVSLHGTLSASLSPSHLLVLLSNPRAWEAAKRQLLVMSCLLTTLRPSCPYMFCTLRATFRASGLQNLASQIIDQ